MGRAGRLGTFNDRARARTGHDRTSHPPSSPRSSRQPGPLRTVFIGPIAGPGQFGPMIVDNLGDLVWFLPLASGVATNLQVQPYQGEPVLAWWEGKVLLPGGYGEGECVLMDTSYRETTRIRAGHGLMADLHELFVTPEGTALITAYRLMEADLTSVGGPSRGTLLDSLLQEIDIATEGALRMGRSHSRGAGRVLPPGPDGRKSL